MVDSIAIHDFLVRHYLKRSNPLKKPKTILQNDPATAMPHRTPKVVSFSKRDTIMPIPNHKRPKTATSDPKAQRAQLKKEISKLEHEFLKTRKLREANELKYEKSHNMKRKQEQARMMACVEGCRMREAVLVDLLSDAKNMLAFAEGHDGLQDKGYAKGYLERMDLWREGVAREVGRRR